MIEPSIKIDLNNITKVDVLDIINIIKVYRYKSHDIDYNNIATITFSKYISSSTYNTINPKLSICADSVIWNRTIEYEINNNILTFINKTNPSIIRFLNGENIKTIKIDIVTEIDWTTIGAKNKDIEMMLKLLEDNNKLDLILFICVVRLFYTLDIDDSNFLIKEQYIKSILYLLKIPLELNDELLTKSKSYIMNRRIDSIFGNIIITDTNDMFLSSPEMRIINYIDSKIII